MSALPSRYEHTGTAVIAHLTVAMTNADVTASCDTLTGWPTGGIGKFWVVIGRGLGTEEKVLVTSKSGAGLLGITRAQDGTAASAHNIGETVEHCLPAAEVDQFAAHIAAAASVHGVDGNVVGSTQVQTLTNKTLTTPVISIIMNTGTLTLPVTTDTLVGRATTDTFTNKTLTSPVINTPTLNGSGGNLILPAGPDTLVGRATTDTLTNKTLTSPTINSPAISGGSLTGVTFTGVALDATSTIGGVSGTSLAADRTVWTSYTPTVTNATGVSVNARYKKIGNTWHVSVFFLAGSVTATNIVTVSLPGTLGAATINGGHFGAGVCPGGGTAWTALNLDQVIRSYANITAGTSLTSTGFTIEFDAS